MQPVRGYKIEKLPIEDLYKVEDLVYFDGPLLSFYANKSGSTFLYYWVDADNEYNRWFVFSVEINELNDFINRKIPLITIIKHSMQGYILDLDKDLVHSDVFLVLTSELPQNYLPKDEYYYDEDLTSSDIFTKYFSLKYGKGVLQTHFSDGESIGYGKMDLDLFSQLMGAFSGVNEGLANSFYKIEKKNQEVRKKKSKIDLQEKTIIKSTFINSYRFEVVNTLAASFSLILKPIENELALSETHTRADKYMEFISEFLSSSESVENLSNYAGTVDLATLNLYENFLSIVEKSHTKFQINYLNQISGCKYNTEIDSKKANQIIQNLQELDYDEDETLILTGKFVALNIKQKKYSFESEDDKSNGNLIGEASKKAREVAFNKTYIVEIQRNSSKKVAGKKTKNHDSLKTISETTESRIDSVEKKG
jgi:hypothetical protein